MLYPYLPITRATQAIVRMSRPLSKTDTYNALRLLAGIATLLILAAYKYIPDKSILILPNPTYVQTTYGPSATSESVSILTDPVGTKFTCHFKESDTYSCGMSLTLSENGLDGINFDNMEGIIIKLKYSGDANRVRIALRNYNPVYGSKDPVALAKNLSEFIHRSEFNKETLIHFNEFAVAEWWVKTFDIPREHSAPEFSNVIAIVFDFVDMGAHELGLEKVEIVGPWIKKERLYLLILIPWMILIIWEGLSRFIAIYLNAKKSNQKIIEMAESYRKLEIEKKEFESLSTTDPLTGITNRAGIEKFISQIFKSNYEKSRLGIILFDIDHFKRINDARGHDTGDRVLESLAKLISANLRDVDVFGRWGGEEFIIIAPQTTSDNLLKLAEKIRACVAATVFEPQRPLQVTISAGVATVKSDEKFDSVFKNADIALYQAKNQGRNCVVHNAEG